MAVAKVKGYKRRTKGGKTVTVKPHNREVKDVYGRTISERPTKYKGVEMYIMEQGKSPDGVGKEYEDVVKKSTKTQAERERIMEADRKAGFARQGDLKTRDDYRRYYAGTFKPKTAPKKPLVKTKKKVSATEYFDGLIDKMDRALSKRRR